MKGLGFRGWGLWFVSLGLAKKPYTLAGGDVPITGGCKKQQAGGITGRVQRGVWWRVSG